MNARYSASRPGNGVSAPKLAGIAEEDPKVPSLAPAPEFTMGCAPDGGTGAARPMPHGRLKSAVGVS